MNGKVAFGIDFIHAMLETNARSSSPSNNALPIARVLLVLEWGLSVEEQDQAYDQLGKQVEAKLLDDFSEVANRLIKRFKDIPEAKAKLLTDIMLITKLDGKLEADEKDFILTFGEIFDFRPSEIGELADRAEDMLKVFSWFATNNYFEKT